MDDLIWPSVPPICADMCGYGERFVRLPVVYSGDADGAMPGERWTSTSLMRF